MGFEPTGPLRGADLESAAFDRSATPAGGGCPAPHHKYFSSKFEHLSNLALATLDTILL